jgi:hypothetical protein
MMLSSRAGSGSGGQTHYCNSFEAPAERLNGGGKGIEVYGEE